MRILVLNVINNAIEIDLTELAIDRTHRIRDSKKEEEKGSSYNCKICQVLWPKRSFLSEEKFKRKRYFYYRKPDKLQDV